MVTNEEKAGVQSKEPKKLNSTLPVGVFTDYPRDYSSLNMADLVEANEQYVKKSDELIDAITLMKYNVYKCKLIHRQLEDKTYGSLKGTVNPRTGKDYSDTAIEAIIQLDPEWQRVELKITIFELDALRAERKLKSLDAQMKNINALTGMLNEDYRKKRG